MVTAKIMLQSKMETGDADSRQVSLVFVPDYADDRNKEWSRYTPGMNLSMTVLPEVAERFETSGKYTLTFTPSED